MTTGDSQNLQNECVLRLTRCIDTIAAARWNGPNYLVEQLNTTNLGFVPMESGQKFLTTAQGNVISWYQWPVGDPPTLIIQHTNASAERISLVSPGGQPGLMLTRGRVLFKPEY